MKKYLLMMLSVFAFSALMAQERTITGTIKDAESGETIPGANIVEKGTANGTITDFDGNYRLTVGDGATLVISFIGYATQEIPIGSRSVIDVSLALDVEQLEEIVVVGYGTQEKKEITSSVASVKAEDFNGGMVNSPAQLIQGKVAGLNITRAGGNPNGGFTIRLRGVSTVGANSEPLIVIDGVIGGTLDAVDPNDIASIDVLKDGSAAAIYGTRGSSGVILITTKSGKAGKTQVDYNGSVNFDNVDRTMEFMDANEYLQQPGAIDLGSNTDWLDEVTQTGVSQIHNISMSGGSQSTTYRAAVNIRDVEGIGINTGFTQLNARLNLTQKALNDRATITMNLSATTKDSDYGFDEAFRYAILSNPTLPVKYDGAAGLTDIGGFAERDVFDYFNPVSIARQNLNDGTDLRMLGSLRAEYDFSDFVDGFRAAIFYSQQRENDERAGYNPKTAKFGDGFSNSGNARRSTEARFNQLIETTVNYDNTFGNTDFAILGGYSYQEFFTEGFGMNGGQFLTDAFTYNNMGASQDFDNGLGSVNSYANSSKLIAFFGRINFNIDGTYFISASVRQEGSTRFGENNKWGTFPAVSAGANLSNLFTIAGVDQLKLRASWGRTGAIPNQSYASLQRFGPQGNFFFNGAYVPSYGPISNPNPDLSWEVKDEIDIGLDFTLLEGRMTGTIDWYTRNTSDMILPVRVPVPPNLFNETLVNIGELTSTGIEFAINYDVVQNSNFTYTAGLNFSTFKTTIESLTSGDLSFGDGGVLYRANMGSPGQNDTRLARVKEGEPLGDLWLPVQEGIDDAGVPIFADLDGDGVYCNCDDDKQVAGNGLPDFTLGFNNTFTFGNFDVNLFFRGAFGHDLLNSYRGFYENVESTTVGSWNVVKTSEFDPSITKAVVNDTHVEDASFFKLDNATIGYTLPTKADGAIRKARFFVAGQNLFTVTGYTGIDPEVRYQDLDDPFNPDPLAPGIERRNTYFTTRTISLGIQLGF